MSVVKDASDDDRHHNGAMTSLLDRVAEVLASGRFASAREWCVKAGVSPNYIGALRSRIGTGEVKQGKSEHLAKLARAANVSLDWLLGEEEPLDASEIRSLVGGPSSAHHELDKILEAYPWPGALEPDAAARVELQMRREYLKSGQRATTRAYWVARLRKIIADELS